MPHVSGHGRPGFSPPASTPSPAFSPQDMNIPEAPAPSQNFGSNVVIGGGGNPGDAGGSTSDGFSGNPFIIGGGGSGGTGGSGGSGGDDDQQTTNVVDTETKVTPGPDTILKNVFNFGTGLAIGNPLVNFGINTLKSFNSNNRFYDKVLEGGLSGIDRNDQVTLANLIARGADERTLKEFIDKRNLSPDERINLSNDIKSLRDRIVDRDYEGLVEQYQEGKPDTFGENLAQLAGKFDRKSGLTREDLRDELGPEGEAYLKATNPQLYYSFTDPQTSQGIAELASQSFVNTGDRVADRRYNARIMEARAKEMDRQTRQDANMGQSSPAFTQPGGPAQPPGTNPPGTPPPTTPPQQPSPPFVPFPSTGIASIFDPKFMGPSFDPRNMADYGRRGIGNRAFDQFYKNLNLFPRA
jgi:hypothetical protein